jgi:hypothetical protein
VQSQFDRDLFKVGRDTFGNLLPIPAIFPDQVAPVVRLNDGDRELTMMRWGMPNPPQYRGSQQFRNTKSPHWRRWLGPEKSMPGTDVLILRVCRHQAAEDTEVVRHRRDATARHLRGDMDRVEWHSRHQGQPVRASIFFTVSCEHCFQTRNAAKLNNAWQRRH